MKIGMAAYKKQLLYFLLLVLPLSLFAQTGERETVAVIPFWGPEDQDILIEEFGAETLEGVNNLQGYRSTPIDMTDLPEDVPEGGYPPNVCPSPSLTRGLPFALTGEIAVDQDFGGWDLRLYLWMMNAKDTDGNITPKLVYSDRLTAYDREGCRMFLPGLLEWIFSFIPKDVPIQLGGGGVASVVYYAPEESVRWLYVGARVGGAMNIYTAPKTENLQPYRDILHSVDIQKSAHYGYNFNVALSAAYIFPDNALFASPFGAQAEIILTFDSKEPFKGTTAIFPIMLRFHAYRKRTSAITALGGVYAGIPFSGDFDYTPQKLWGVTAGFNFGEKIGPGHAYLDLRWMGDMTDTYKNTGEAFPYPGFRRNMISVCIGYEMGFFPKAKTR